MRPFVYINSAMSADGKISSVERRQVRISCKADLERVDELRAGRDAVMVGIGTVLADDPGLKVKSETLRRHRLENGLTENPLRVVVDSRARTPLDSKILGSSCIIAVAEDAPKDRVAALEGRCEVVVCGLGRVDLQALMSYLFSKGVRRLMVEGGATLNWSLIEAGLVDEICVYVGAMIIGGGGAPTLVDGSGFKSAFPRLDLVSLEKMDDGALILWRLVRSE
jgi:2,5-diamino-6-(ribosylamino)-4(3H)-pyrimidinone 5'-phosphate reductase